MANTAFPPTPAQGPAPSPVGTAVSGAGPQMGQIAQQAKAGLQAFMMIAKLAGQAKPEAAQKIIQGITMLQQGINDLKGGAQPGPTSPQGAVPPPPQMAAESPTPETPEAT